MQSNLYPELKNSKFKVLIFELPQQTSDTQNDKKINIPRKLFECCFFFKCEYSLKNKLRANKYMLQNK